jgi:hypothetical protein
VCVRACVCNLNSDGVAASVSRLIRDSRYDASLTIRWDKVRLLVGCRVLMNDRAEATLRSAISGRFPSSRRAL